MNTTKTILAAIATASCTSFATTPVVSNVTMAQSDSSRLVTINYTLDSEAVVTLDIQTNYVDGAETKWASIGGAAISGTQTGKTSGPAQGDVWKVVSAGNGTITWRPDYMWPDQGREATDISDLEFTDIRMDAVCARPVYVHVSGHPGTKVRAVRGLRFKNVVARGLMHPVVSAPRPGLVSDISFVDCRFTREPALPERYPNGGNVGFAECQRFPNDIPDANVENLRRTRTTLA